MNFKLFILISLLFSGITDNRCDSDNIIGRWRSCESGIIIDIYKSGGKYYGKVVKANKEEAVNKIILQNFVYSVSDKWKGGKVYAPKRDKYYDAEIILLEKNKMEIKARVFLASKSTIWERAN